MISCIKMAKGKEGTSKGINTVLNIGIVSTFKY